MSTSSSSGSHLVQTHAGPGHAASVSLSHVCGSPADLRGLVFLVSSVPLALKFFHLLFHRVPWALPEGRDLMETSHLGLNVQRSLTLGILPVSRSLYLFRLLQEEASLMMAEQSIDL